MSCGQTRSSAKKTRILNAGVTRPLYSVNSATVSLRTLIPTAICVFRNKIGYWTRQHTDKITHESIKMHVYTLYSPVLHGSEESGDDYKDGNVVLQHVSSLGLLCCIYCKPLLRQTAGSCGWMTSVWGSPDYFIKLESSKG